jgi:formylmethanofuran dehydrogenase subunit E
MAVMALSELVLQAAVANGCRHGFFCTINNMGIKAKLTLAAAKLKVEDKGIVVILEKCYDGNDVDDIDKFNFTTK